MIGVENIEEEEKSLDKFLLEPFKVDEVDTKEYCIDCEYEEDCAILVHVNKLNKIRLAKQGKKAQKANGSYGCVLFSTKG